MGQEDHRERDDADRESLHEERAGHEIEHADAEGGIEEDDLSADGGVDASWDDERPDREDGSSNAD